MHVHLVQARLVLHDILRLNMPQLEDSKGRFVLEGDAKREGKAAFYQWALAVSVMTAVDAAGITPTAEQLKELCTTAKR